MQSDWSVCPYCSYSLVGFQEKAPSLIATRKTNNSFIQPKVTKVTSTTEEKRARRNRVGRGLVVYGIIQLIIVTFLFYLAPEVFSIWYIKVNTIYDNFRWMFGGFASMGTDLGSGLSFNPIQGEPVFIVIVATMLIGMIIGLMGAGARSKGVTISGGLLLMVSFLITIVVIGGGIGMFGAVADVVGLVGQNPLYGSYRDITGGVSWGIGAGTIIPLISGIIIISGGALLERKILYKKM